jgi:hypothetical protein
MRKIQRQPRAEVSAPPTSGPTANEPPIVAPYAASTFTRSCVRGNVWESTASETANMTAAPRPCAARAALSIVIDCAAAHSSEVAVKRPRPTRNRRRRPKRSASEPAVITVAASGSV